MTAETPNLAGDLRGAIAFAALLAAAAPAGAADWAEEARLAPRSLLLDGAATPGGERLVVVGERGHILHSDDEGRSWTQARVPTRALLTAVHMHDASLGWAAGHDATILRTRDGGESWETVHSDPALDAPLLDLWFRDARRGFAVGGFGLFLATEDGGDSWTCRHGCAGDEAPPLLRGAAGNPADDEFGDDFHLNRIAPSPAGDPDAARRLWLAGEAGALYRSDDGGQSWRALDSPYAGSWFAALALDADTVLAAGLRGRLFRSDDGGESWSRVETGTEATLTDAALAPDGRVVIVGLSGTLLIGSDGARSVSLLPQPSRQGAAAALAGGGGLLTIGEFGVRRVGEAAP